MKTEKLNKLKQDCLTCKKCILGETRNNIVFSDGNPESAKAILIGEAPGENEDKTGTPFVGRAGKLLNEFLEKAGISREKDLYIINTVKCRPPKNRVPSDEEKKLCEDYLLQQIEIINEELHYPPQKNQGISLWSVSRYIKGILSIIIKHKLDSVDIKWEEYESKRVKNELLKLKQWMEKYLSNEYDISVCRRTRISEENHEVFFCIDIPLYAEKYPDALFKEDKK